MNQDTSLIATARAQGYLRVVENRSTPIPSLLPVLEQREDDPALDGITISDPTFVRKLYINSVVFLNLTRCREFHSWLPPRPLDYWFNLNHSIFDSLPVRLALQPSRVQYVRGNLIKLFTDLSVYGDVAENNRSPICVLEYPDDMTAHRIRDLLEEVDDRARFTDVREAIFFELRLEDKLDDTFIQVIYIRFDRGSREEFMSRSFARRIADAYYTSGASKDKIPDRVALANKWNEFFETAIQENIQWPPAEPITMPIGSILNLVRQVFSRWKFLLPEDEFEDVADLPLVVAPASMVDPNQEDLEAVALVQDVAPPPDPAEDDPQPGKDPEGGFGGAENDFGIEVPEEVLEGFDYGQYVEGDGSIRFLA